MIDKEIRMKCIYERVKRANNGKCLTADDIILFLDDEIKHYRKKIENYSKPDKEVETLKEELRIVRSDNEMLKDTIIRLTMKLTGVLPK